MNGTVFWETLRRGWRGMLYWGLGLAAYGLMLTLIVQDANILKQYGEIAKAFPPALLKLFGGDATMLATPEGFLAYGFFGYMLLIFAVYAILSGLNITANEEDQGIMDVVLSLPVPRHQVIVEKFLAYTLMIVVIIAIAFLGLLVGSQFSALKIDATKLLQSTLNIVPSALLMVAFTAWAGTFFRSKATATAVAAFFVVGSYFLNFLGEAASETVFNALRSLSFFRYYDHNAVILNGLSWSNVGLLLAVTVALVAGSLWFFQRRDIGV
jgi:ABC-type transport system involved in multi-copper enzyme maturation permease subunit